MRKAQVKGGTVMYFTANPFAAAFAGMAIVCSAWMPALQQASVEEPLKP
jgi:hypothetical protein